MDSALENELSDFIVHSGIEVSYKEMRPKLVKNIHVVRGRAERGIAGVLKRF
jgi:hypothetical protein